MVRMFKYRNGILRGLSLIFAVAPLVSFALPAPVLQDETDVNLKILCPIASFFFYILIVLSIIMILYAAYLYLTSAGDTTKIKQAGQTITYAAVGIAVALLANNIPQIVGSLLGWNTIKRC